MQTEFEDDDLRRLYTEPDFRLPWMGSDLLKHFRRKIAFIVAAEDERDLWAMRSLRFEKLVGDRKGQYSVRLNDKYRLILRLKTDDDGQFVIVIEVVDYH